MIGQGEHIRDESEREEKWPDDTQPTGLTKSRGASPALKAGGAEQLEQHRTEGRGGG